MKHIIRYLLEGDGSVPKFVEDGGYFPLNDELIGVSIDSSKRHLPSSVHKMSREELIARVEIIDSEANAEEVVDEFLDSKGL